MSPKFHISLNVANLDRAVAFYKVLFDRAPAKCRPDYAKFELEDPAVVLSLEPQRHGGGGSLNHLGLRLPDSPALVEMQRRLESGGLATTREDNVACCYARQTKFWIADPDKNNWEFYVVEEDLEHKGNSPRPGGAAQAQDSAAAEREPVVWEHRLGEAASAGSLSPGSVDEALLRGTFNADVPAADLIALLRQVLAALRIGGKVSVHGLAADAPLKTQPKLPGPAAAVQRVPMAREVTTALEAAGFAAVRVETLGASCCFHHEGIGLRELLVSALKPGGSQFDLKRTVIYKGPLREVQDDLGNVFRRGVPATVPSSAAELLLHGPMAESFAAVG